METDVHQTDQQSSPEFAPQLLSGPLHYARRTIWCESRGGKLFLHGVVRSYYHKQLAQEKIRELIGGTDLENCIQVD